MLTKFETKSAKVKGLSFHSTRPWILASLYNGTIQLWDYRIGTLLETFDAHSGPVRGICFHNKQPLFVSGGDDYKVKLWNYKLKRCLCTLIGHFDYIRTIMFHQDYPWIISASDDQTIRIWNWQSRSCISILTGHNHYVMCAMFHPLEDLLVSASLDQTIRIWDISGLTKKNAVLGSAGLEEHQKNPGSTELFVQASAVVKHLLEGHERGINWVTFHPTLPLLVSAADDRQVKLWRMNDSKAWEIDTCHGHYNNVSCVIFHPKQDLILSNSEDKSIKVWDIIKRRCLYTFRRESERFWIITAHPTLNLFAAGHDGGMIVFKLERERPAYTVHGNNLYYVKNAILRKLDFATSRDVSVTTLKNDKMPVYGISMNVNETIALLYIRSSNSENYYYYFLNMSPVEEIQKNNLELQNIKGIGLTAFWITRDRFVVLDKSSSVVVKEFTNTIVKELPIPSCNEIFYAGTDMLLLRDNDNVTLFDIQRNNAIGQVKITNCRYVAWSSDMKLLALLGKNVIIICNCKMEILSSLRESMRIKSGTWNPEGVFIYNTSHHIKYSLQNGNCGIIRTLDVAIYITKVENDKIFCLDRECNVKVLSLSNVEYSFKLALIQHQYDKVFKMIKECCLVGQSIISYLHKQGYPEIALSFVKDDYTRFSLASEYGNIDVALEAARVLNQDIFWLKLADTALIYGNYKVVEICYQKTKSFGKLAFLYLITGNLNNIHKMMKISEIQNKKSCRLQNALLLNDYQEIIQILNESMLNNLACLVASTYGFNINDKNQISSNNSKKFLRTPPPIQQISENWPLLMVRKSFFENISKLNTFLPNSDNHDEYCWMDSEDHNDSNIQNNNNNIGWEDTNIDVSVPLVDALFTLPICNLPLAINSNFAINHIAKGSFVTACALLHNQYGIVNFKPYRQLFLNLYSSSQCYFTSHCNTSPRLYPLEVKVNFNSLLQELQEYYSLTTNGKFVEAVDGFKALILKTTLTSASNKQEVLQAKQLLKTCQGYTLALNIEIIRKKLPRNTLEDQIRHCELAAYMTHCDLQPNHLILSLRSAINLCFKIKNYKTTTHFANRLLELGPKREIVEQTHKILKASRANLTNKLRLQYNEYNPFDVCGISYKPIYKGEQLEKCMLCGTSYLPKFKWFLCKVCDVAEIGRD